MFYPGDPVEQHKQMLLKKLAGGGRHGGGGFRVGRQAGQFGGGMRGGMAGQGQGLPGMLQGYGQGGGYQGGGDPNLGFSSFIQDQGAPQGMVSGGGRPPQGVQTLQPAIPPDLLRQILGGYGSQPQPYPNAGFPTRGFGVS